MKCPVLVITAVVMAFPGLIGSTDDPTYALTVVFLALAVVVGIDEYGDGFPGRSSKRSPSKESQIVLAARKYAAGTLTLEEYGSYTKEILNDK